MFAFQFRSFSLRLLPIMKFFLRLSGIKELDAFKDLLSESNAETAINQSYGNKRFPSKPARTSPSHREIEKNLHEFNLVFCSQASPSEMFFSGNYMIKCFRVNISPIRTAINYSISILRHRTQATISSFPSSRLLLIKLLSISCTFSSPLDDSPFFLFLKRSHLWTCGFCGFLLSPVSLRGFLMEIDYSTVSALDENSQPQIPS